MLINKIMKNVAISALIFMSACMSEYNGFTGPPGMSVQWSAGGQSLDEINKTLESCGMTGISGGYFTKAEYDSLSYNEIESKVWTIETCMQAKGYKKMRF